MCACVNTALERLRGEAQRYCWTVRRRKGSQSGRLIEFAVGISAAVRTIPGDENGAQGKEVSRAVCFGECGVVPDFCDAGYSPASERDDPRARAGFDRRGNSSSCRKRGKCRDGADALGGRGIAWRLSNPSASTGRLHGHGRETGLPEISQKGARRRRRLGKS